MRPGSIGWYEKPGKDPELRIHFDEWELDGVCLHNVTIFPHRCRTCVGGDHTHVEINDQRKPVTIVAKDAVLLSPEDRAIVDTYLRAKLQLFQVTNVFDRYLDTYRNGDEEPSPFRNYRDQK